MRRTLLALLSVAMLGGCMHNLSFIPSGVPYASHPNVSPGQVRLYRPEDPLPPFTEIGYLEYDQIFTTGVTDMQRVQRSLAAEASVQGCNAVVLHDGCSRVSRDRHGAHYFPRIAATCIWVDDP